MKSSGGRLVALPSRRARAPRFRQTPIRASGTIHVSAETAEAAADFYPVWMRACAQGRNTAINRESSYFTFAKRLSQYHCAAQDGQRRSKDPVSGNKLTVIDDLLTLA